MKRLRTVCTWTDLDSGLGQPRERDEEAFARAKLRRADACSGGGEANDKATGEDEEALGCGTEQNEK